MVSRFEGTKSTRSPLSTKKVTYPFKHVSRGKYELLVLAASHNNNKVKKLEKMKLQSALASVEEWSLKFPSWFRPPYDPDSEIIFGK